MADHMILLGAFIDTEEGCEGEPLLQVRCTCGTVLLESGDGGDEMVSLFEICCGAREHLKKEHVPVGDILMTFPRGIR
jgi:hypothetical protein